MHGRTSNRVQREVGEPPVAQNRDKCDRAAEAVAAVVDRVRHEHRAAFLVRDAFRDAVQPLLRDDAKARKPRRVWVERARTAMPMRVRVDVGVLRCSGRYSLSDVDDAREQVVQHARADCGRRSREGVHEKGPGVHADAKRAASEQD